MSPKSPRYFTPGKGPNMSYSRALHLFAVVTACSTFVLLVMGALVTSNDAGLSVPDWPLSYGSLTPPMVGGIVYEHTHRVVATFIGILTIALNILLWRLEPRPWVRRLGLVALFAVIVQGLLGGMTVLLSLPPVVSVAHACLAQTFFCLVISLAVVTGPGWTEQGRRLGAFWLPVATTAMVFVQLILGAVLRHAGTIDGDKAADFVLPAFIAHLGGAGLAAIMLVWLALHLTAPKRAVAMPAQAYTILSLLVLQLVLGLGSYLARLDAAAGNQPVLIGVVLSSSHLAIGALLLALSLIAALRESRELLPAGAPINQLQSAGELS